MTKNTYETLPHVVESLSLSDTLSIVHIHREWQ